MSATSSQARLIAGSLLVLATGVLWHVLWPNQDSWAFWLQPAFGLMAGFILSRTLKTVGKREEMQLSHGLLAGLLVGGVLAFPLLSETPAARLVSTQGEEAPVSREEDALAALATDIALERANEGRALEWPPGMTVEYAADQEDFPAEVWQEAVSAWEAMNFGQQQALIVQRQELGKQLQPSQIEAAASGIVGRILWIFVSMSCAFLASSRLFVW